MPTARIVELRLSAFKSFQAATLPISQTTILIGRNSTGKSNALDGLEVLARLATGDDLGDALDGRRREGGAVRGGSAGLPPHGCDHFALGCTVSVGGDSYEYDLKVAVRPELRVISERLYGPGVAVKSGSRTLCTLVETREANTLETGIAAELHNGKRGLNPPYTFRDNRLIITQLPLAVAGSNRAEVSLLEAATAILSALRGTFHLDPIPHLMRDYVPSRDAELRRTGENLSASLQRLQTRDSETFARLQSLVREVADDRIERIGFVRSELGDVMLALDERRGPGGDRELTPAREMSDGLLRFTAIATALLSSTTGLDVDSVGALPTIDTDTTIQGGVLIVVEELENGLHPSQARRVLDLVRTSSAATGTRVLVTTHSPALLDAAEGHLNEAILVCSRDPHTGFSTITPLMNLPGYGKALAQRSLGGAVAAGDLDVRALAADEHAEFDALLGIG